MFFVSISCARAQEVTPAETTIIETAPVEIISQETVTIEKHVEAKKRHDDNPRPYDGERDAMADVDAALNAARENETKALIVLGAN